MYAIDFIDQFAYGIGYVAYTIILMRVAQQGQFKTSHFAIGTGLGALCIAIAGIVSGVIQQQTGYVGLFIAVMVMTVPGMLSLVFLPWDRLEN
jgi:PAT family beta-lactamase induction signal transducer AmpG